MPALPAYPHSTTHYLYLRPNAPRVPTENTPRELFLANIPVDSSAAVFRALFAGQLGGGRVVGVEFEGSSKSGGKGIAVPDSLKTGRGKKRKRARDDADGRGEGDEEEEIVGQLPDVWERSVHPSGSTAVVRFVDRVSAEMALRKAKRVSKSGKSVSWEEAVKTSGEATLGSQRYLAHHRLKYADAAVLQASVDEFMAAFTAQETERARLLAKQRSVPDEDGFITVTRGGRVAPAREGAAQAKEEEFKKREKNRIKEDFYRFQVREKRKEQAKDLVRGFEDDRRKVEEMRKRRGKVRPE